MSIQTMKHESVLGASFESLTLGIYSRAYSQPILWQQIGIPESPAAEDLRNRLCELR